MTIKVKEKLRKYWDDLYPDDDKGLFASFLLDIEKTRSEIDLPAHQPEWYKDAVVYSLYVDLFNNDFNGLTNKLDYLQDLGINCLWLLPILESPMKDSGFDISNYRMIRSELTGLGNSAGDEETLEVFANFLSEAHKREIQVIFDVAINHSSQDHFWFQESRKSPDNPYRDYYIWNNNDRKYKECRLLFKGMCPSNWEKDGEYYYFHRFFEHQPDLNYKNPQVLTEMSKNLLFWLKIGVDGFRADAIPYLWKEEGTDCENLPKTHTIVKFFRAVLDYVRPHTLLLAEACQPPFEVVKYFGNEDECHAGYHFPLMPQIFKAISMSSGEPVISVLGKDVTPAIPDTCQWFTFLRCHDELSLELVYVSEEDRKYIHENYCHNPSWNFRVGEGISARISELMQHNPEKIKLAFSIMLTLPGTPIIYYGDEFGKSNDQDYYKKSCKETGYDDTRYLVRGKIDWEHYNNAITEPLSFESQVLHGIKKMITIRQQFKTFGRGNLAWVKPDTNYSNVLAYIRTFESEKVLIVQNLSDHKTTIESSPFGQLSDYDMLNNSVKVQNNNLILNPWEYHWFEMK